MTTTNASSALFSLLALSFLLTACGGGFVDTEGSGFVDTTGVGGFDRDSVSVTQPPRNTQPEPVVVNETSEDFVPPPQEAVQGPTPVPYEEAFVGKNAVGAWVRTERGAVKVFMPEGAILPLDGLDVTIEVEMLTTGSGGEPVAVFVADGKRLPSVKAREQVIDGRVSIFVTEILLK